jgi:hypothetical protein
MTSCPHCGRAVLADRTGPGVAIEYASGDASETSFVLGARCPYPSCARPVFARAIGPGIPAVELALTTLPDVVAWSPSLLARAIREWGARSSFVRGLGCAARDALRDARLSRVAVGTGGCGGLRVTPDPTTYRSH